MEDPVDGAGEAPEMARAEEMVDQAAQVASAWVAKIGHEILRTAARAREEAEDIWAEAQHLADRPSD